LFYLPFDSFKYSATDNELGKPKYQTSQSQRHITATVVLDQTVEKMNFLPFCSVKQYRLELGLNVNKKYYFWQSSDGPITTS